MSEDYFTLREAAETLGLSIYQVRYAVLSRPVPRRMAGNCALVKLSDLRRALDDVRHEHDWRRMRANTRTVSN